MNSNAELPLLLEIKRRRAARTSLVEWCKECGWTPAEHHLLVLTKLEALVKGTAPKRKLAIFLPPGSAKSTYASVCFPPWFLAQRASSAILTASHSGDLAESFGRRARNLIDQHGPTLGYRLRDDSKAAGRWETSNGGLFFCAGVGAGIAGHRADLGLIDDPVGKKEDADSKLIRDKQWDWYNYDFLPRLKPGALLVLIQTRWHEDDLAGRILKNEGADWEVVRLPFFAEENDLLGRDPAVDNGSRLIMEDMVPYPKGEMLWPSWYKKEMYPKDPQVGQSLYQNNPTPEEGNLFKADWILTYGPSELPKELRNYVGSDHAVGLRQENDRTCLLPAGIDYLGRMWILPNWFWKKADSGVVVEAMLDLTKQYRPVVWWAESGHISKAIGPFLTVRGRERNIFVPIEEVTSSKDKSTRAQSIASRMRQKMVLFPYYAPGWQEARHELLSFPYGEYDDFVDALSELGQGLDRQTRASVPPPPMEELLRPSRGITLGWIRKSHERRHPTHRCALLDY